MRVMDRRPRSETVAESAMIPGAVLGPTLAKERGGMGPRPTASALLALGLGGCLYYQDINSRPVARIEGPSVVHEDELVTYLSKSSDRDQDELTSAWQAFRCPRPTDCDPLTPLLMVPGGV